MTHNIIMPDLGQTVAEGKVLRWLKKPGDRVTRGEALLEVETDKVTMEVESYRSGYLRAFLVREGEMAGAMSPIALLTDLAEEPLAADRPGVEETGSAVHGHVAGGPPATPGLTGAHQGGRVAATPAGRIRARELGIDLSTLVAARPDGLITRRDVDRVLVNREALRPVHPMAAITTKSVQSIPHFYAMVDADMSAAVAWRKQWNSAYSDSRLSLNDIFVRAASLALRDLPALNVRFSRGMVEQRTNADILLVVATSKGLSWVPLSDPAALAWEEHAQRMRRAVKTPDQGLSAPALPEGSPALAISNLGMFGVKQFTAIIPPDSAAILAIGAVREEPVIRDRQMVVGEKCALTLAADHRIVDGVTAAKFLENIQVQLKSL